VRRHLLPRLEALPEGSAALSPDSSLRPLRWCVQRPGDLVDVPAGWWHCVLNLEESVAVQVCRFLPP
jgi:hypothetical protein